jgi:hypothetical protein
MNKKFKVIIAIVAIGIIGSAVFYACKKEDTLETNAKVQKSMSENDLQAYEFYTPSESEMQEKLLSFANYVNKSEEYVMPNTELKEVIWLMETFFNIGVCEKQKYFVAQSDSKKNYQIKVSFENEGNNIRIKGEEFQIRYLELLRKVIEEICPKFALDFGDVYVSNIDYASYTLTLDMDVLYGTKGEGDFDALGRNIIINPNNPVHLYNSYPNVFDIADFYPKNYVDRGPDSWIIDSTGASKYIRDADMEKMLNPRFVMYTPINIIHRKLVMDISWYNIHTYQDEVIYYEGSYHNPVTKTPALSRSEYEQYGTKYRDYIYMELYPKVPSDYSPLYACCFYLEAQLVSMNPPDYLWQTFGIEYICQFSTSILTAAVQMIRFEDKYATAYLKY